MNGVIIDAKAVLGFLVIVGSFVILGIYVFKGQVPDAAIAAIVSGAFSGVMAYYFGHQNGSTSALATAAAQLANQAIEKRTPTLAALPVTVVAAAPSPPTPSSA